MFFAKRRSYISIEIESMELIRNKKVSLERALIIINNEQTFIQHLFIVYYNIIKKLLTFIYITNIYCKTFYVNKFRIKNKEHWYISDKSVNLHIFDDCIYINNFKIPYEYIIFFRNLNNTVYIKIFGNIVNENNKLNLELSEGFIEILCEYSNSKMLIDCIKKNMYYHIKYNKIDQNVISFFLNNIET